MNTTQPSQPGQQSGPVGFEFYILVIWLILLAGVAVFFIVHNATWVYGDDWILTSTIGQGRPYRMDQTFNIGRFVPLSFQEYNAFIPVRGQPLAVYCWVALKFVLFVVFLYLSLAQALSRPWSLFASGLFLVFSANLLLMIFTEAIYPENSQLLLLAVFSCCYLKAAWHNQGAYYFPAALAACLACYFKEPTFGLFMVIAAVNLVFRYRSLAPGEKRFSYFLFINGLIYLSLYYGLIISNQPAETASSYLGLWNARPRQDIVLMMIKSSGGLLVIGPLARLAHWLVHLKRPEIPFRIGLADALGAGGLAYGGAFVVLGIGETYYFAGSTFLAFLACCLYAHSYAIMLRGRRQPEKAGQPAAPRARGVRLRILGAAILLAWSCGGLAWFINTGLGSATFLSRRLSLAVAGFWPDLLQLGYNMRFWVPPASPKDTARYIYKYSPWTTYYNHNSKSHCGESCPPLSFDWIYDFKEFGRLDKGALISFAPITPWRDDPDYLSFVAYPANLVIKRANALEMGRLIMEHLVVPEDLAAVVAAKADLDRLRDALAAYHKQWGAYPKSKGMAGLYRLDGVLDRDWIPGLAPAYIDQLPRDRRRSRDPYKQYIYMSDGRNYKLLAHNPASDTNAVFQYPELIDPVRDWCIGYWTPAAETW